MQSIPRVLSLAATVAAMAAATSAVASSHREAPMITQLPKVDNTDVYAFRSYEPGRADYVTLIANFIPFQDPFAGPNYYAMDPEAVYEIHIDNNGDGSEDLTFQFRFASNNKNTSLNVGGKSVPIPLINSGPITGVNPPTLNVNETYTVGVVIGSRRGGAGQLLANMSSGDNVFQKPVDNIGRKSIPDYAAYAAKHVYTAAIPGCAMPGRVFVGQRYEGFRIAVGEIFDLVNMTPARLTGSRTGSTNNLEAKNVTSIAVEVPIRCIASPSDPVIGVWSTASLPRSRAGANGASGGNGDGGLVQVSRLGMPLVNEVIIGLRDKDAFNASEPTNDGQFADYVTNPTLPVLLETLFGAAGVKAPTAYPRLDLVAAFLTGVPNVNQPKRVTPAEMIRLNTSIPVTPKGTQNSLGAALCFVDGALRLSNPGCDPAGFPNGRRPGDDVVDIELRVAMGYLLPPGPNKPASASLPYTDGVLVEDSQFDNAFPYLRTPLPGSPNGANGQPANPAGS